MLQVTLEKSKRTTLAGEDERTREFKIPHIISLRVAVPTPEEKREGGNVYKELAQIELCDVTVIYVTYVNKLYFLSGRKSPRATRIPRQNACQKHV